MAGFNGSIMFADNVDFSGSKGTNPAITLDGQFFIGSTTFPNIRTGMLTSTGGTITITYVAPNINLEVAHPVSSLTFDIDVGGPITPVANVISLNGIGGNQTVTTGAGEIAINNLYWQTSYVVDPSTTPGEDAKYQTIQAAINAVVASGVSGNIFIRTGTYTENLTLSTGANLIGVADGRSAEFGATNANVTQIIGNHTLNSTGGVLGLQQLAFFCTTTDPIFALTSSGVCEVGISNCLAVNESTGPIATVDNSGVGTFTLFAFQSSLGATSGTEGIILTGGGSLALGLAQVSTNGNVINVQGNAAIFNIQNCNLTGQTAAPFACITFSSTVGFMGLTDNMFDGYAGVLGTGGSAGIQSLNNLWSCQAANGFYIDSSGGAATINYNYVNDQTDGSATQIDPLVNQNPISWRPRAQAIAAPSTGGQYGTCAFNSAQFTLNDGWVSLIGGGVNPPITSVTVDASTTPGTDPVLADGGGNITVTGGQVPAGSIPNVIQTNSLADNTYTIQIQQSAAVGASDPTQNGVSHFDSAFFTVDGNAFVSFNGTAFGQTITGDIGGPLSPTAGNWDILGVSVPAGTTPVDTSGTGSTLTVQVQTAQAIASTNASNIGLAAFDSAFFSVDANGFVSFTGGGGGGIVTIDGDTGSITGTTVTIKAGVSTQNCGSSVEFVNAGTTSTLNVTDASANTLIGLTSGNATLSGTTNNSLGSLSLKSLTTGSSNNAVGYQALTSLTSGSTNTAVGQQALESLVSNSNNCAFGYGVLQNCTGSNNTSVGQQSAKNITSGSFNCALGNLAGNSLATTDSSNIDIMNNGTAGDNNTIRIGTQGTGNGQQNKAFMAGINGVTVTTPALVTIDTGTNQLGTIPTTSLPYFSLTPYIVGSDIHSQFTTIQAAINQAVTDGASATSPKNIYIKAGTYTENLTLHDGVYLIVFDFLGANQINANFKIVKIVGNATISSSGTSWLRFTGISFDGGAGVPIAITTTGTGNVIANLDLCSCVGGTFFFSCSNSTNGQNNLFLNDCNVAIPLVTSSGGLTNISDVGSLISQNGPSVFSSSAAGPASWTATNCQYSAFTIRNSNSQGITFIAQNTTIGGTATGNLFEINSSGSFSTIFNACYLSAITALFTSTSTGSASYQLVDTSIAESSIANSVVSGGISASITSGSSYLTTDFGPTWTGPNITGYFGSHAYLGQSVVHTTAITATTLVSIAVPAGTALTITGQVTGSNAGHTDITGASYFVTCDGTAAAIIGVPLITINASTTGLVTASFSGGHLLIQVTAPSTAAYNWVSSYQVQPLISNT